MIEVVDAGDQVASRREHEPGPVVDLTLRDEAEPPAGLGCCLKVRDVAEAVVREDEHPIAVGALLDVIGKDTRAGQRPELCPRSGPGIECRDVVNAMVAKPWQVLNEDRATTDRLGDRWARRCLTRGQRRQGAR